MKHIHIICAMTMIAAVPQLANAQTSSDKLAQQWRDAKRRELLDQRAKLDNQLVALDGTTPALIAVPVAVPFAVAITAPVLAIDPPAKPPLSLPAGPPGIPIPGAPTAVLATGNATPLQTASLQTVATPAIMMIVPPPAGTPPPGGPRGSFGGIDFGIGISFTLDVGTSDRITDASLMNGMVRVNDEDNGRARIMLESHFLFTPVSKIDVLGVENSLTDKEWGFGPFVALQPGTEDVIEAIGMGLMFGFRRGAGDESFNIGFGIVVDPNTRILGEGVIANQPLSNGETEVRYKEELQTGFLILSSFSF